MNTIYFDNFPNESPVAMFCTYFRKKPRRRIRPLAEQLATIIAAEFFLIVSESLTVAGSG